MLKHTFLCNVHIDYIQHKSVFQAIWQSVHCVKREVGKTCSFVTLHQKSEPPTPECDVGGEWPL